MRRLLLLGILIPSLALADEPSPVALSAGSMVPYNGILLSRVRAAKLEAKALALVELRKALIARSAEATALRSAVALHIQREEQYHELSDKASKSAAAQRAKNRSDAAKGFLAGVAVGGIMFKAIGWLLGGL